MRPGVRILWELTRALSVLFLFANRSPGSRSAGNNGMGIYRVRSQWGYQWRTAYPGISPSRPGSPAYVEDHQKLWEPPRHVRPVAISKRLDCPVVSDARLVRRRVKMKNHPTAEIFQAHVCCSMSKMCTRTASTEDPSTRRVDCW